jgi:hypothetical protein
VPALLDRVPQLIEEVGQLLSEEWSDYARFLTEGRDEVLVATEEFIRRLVVLAEQGLAGVAQDPVPEPGGQVALFEEIGRIQWREGRELTTLLSAYQVGAKAAWHHVSDTALAVGVEPEALAALAEAVFVFVDGLSSASARGYVLEQSESAGARERLRDELTELLLSDRSDSAAVRAAAVRAGWPQPAEAAVVLVDPDNEAARTVLGRLPDSCLPIRRAGQLGCVVPDPSSPGRRQRLAASLRGTGAVIGPAVALEHLPAGRDVAEIAGKLVRAGLLTDDPVFADEHLDAIIVHRDRELLEALRRQVLAPLEGSSPAAYQRSCETLASWLRHMGDRHAIAAELHIHPQTVRYRMGQLHTVFGSALDDPDVRARLTLALAWTPIQARPRGRAGDGRRSRRSDRPAPPGRTQENGR